MKKPNLVVLTGAGISAESGLATFRGDGGLWEGHDIMEVASIEGWHRNPGLVLDFYNMRRAAAAIAMPNAGHFSLAALELDFEVWIITQNVDDLHERAGSTRVLHLHGQLNEMRSVKNENLVAPIVCDLRFGDLAPDGGQWRPNIVWFGEAVPYFEKAVNWVRNADFFAVIGTSLQVYPAAGLQYEAQAAKAKFLIDPNGIELGIGGQWRIIPESASSGIEKMNTELMKLVNIH
jgi:NAD-dependent deacetylase